MINKKAGKLFIIFFLALCVPIVVLYSDDIVNFFSEASGSNAELAIDMDGNYGRSFDSWQNLAQGGEERGRMLAPVIAQVRDLKPKYIRIDHVFDYYDQNALDQVISDILQTGAKPFISLSYMPPNLSKGGDVTDLPRNWTDWENLVQKIIEHISGRSGLAIPDVYYEVWNEPDLFGKFKMYGPKNYLDLYYHTVIPAQRISNTLPFKIGGPATTGYYQNWMNGLVNFANKNSLRLDFISWHKYSKKLSDFESDVSKARSLGKEMIISEMGPNSENDPVYDGSFSAIHQLAVSAMLHNEVNKIFAFEIIDGPSEEKYWGRWGMFTHPKHGTPEMKKRGQAMVFLNNLSGGDNMKVFGQGSWVKVIAKKYGDLSKIMLVNYDPKGFHSESVPIKFVNLKDGGYLLKRIHFSGEVMTEEFNPTEGIWQTNQYMTPNSAVIIEISLKN